MNIDMTEYYKNINNQRVLDLRRINACVKVSFQDNALVSKQPILLREHLLEIKPKHGSKIGNIAAQKLVIIKSKMDYDIYETEYRFNHYGKIYNMNVGKQAELDRINYENGFHCRLIHNKLCNWSDNLLFIDFKLMDLLEVINQFQFNAKRVIYVTLASGLNRATLGNTARMHMKIDNENSEITIESANNDMAKEIIWVLKQIIA